MSFYDMSTNPPDPPDVWDPDRHPTAYTTRRTMITNRVIVTLWDGRRGYFYTSHFAGTPLFQPIGDDGCALGKPELRDPDDHQLLETT